MTMHQVWTRLWMTMLLVCGGFMAQADELDTPIAALTAFELGGDSAPLTALHDAVIASKTGSDVEARHALATRLAKVLSDASATYDAKQFVCRMLMLIGTEEQIAALAPMLTDERHSDMARYALEKIDSAKVELALLDALAAAAPPVQVGLLNSLGARRAAGGTEIIRSLASMTSDPAVLAAAAHALAEISVVDKLAFNALQSIATAREAEAPNDICDALLKAADARFAAGDKDAAKAAYRKLYVGDRIESIKRVAFVGWMKAEQETASKDIPGMLLGEDERLARFALSWVANAEVGETAEYATLLNTIPSHRIPALLIALGDRGDSVALQSLVDRLRSRDAATAQAALEAVTVLGDRASLMPLLELARDFEDPQRRAALTAIARLRAEGLNEALLAMATDAAPELRGFIIESLGARQVTEATPQLLVWAASEDPITAATSVKALGRVADAESMDDVLALLAAAPSDAQRQEIESALSAMLRRQPDPATRFSSVAAALSSEVSATVRASLVRVLGSVPDEAALPAIEAQLTNEDEAVRVATVDVLAKWPTSSPLQLLLGVAKDESLLHDLRNRALEGYIRLARLQTDQSAEERIAMFEEALALTEDTRLMGQAISGLGEVPDRAALDAIQRYAESEGLKREVRVAAENVRKLFYVATASHASEEAAKALDGKIDTRWTSGALQSPGMWFELDLSESVKSGGIILDNSRSSTDVPVGYKVYLFDDPAAMGEPVAEGTDAGPMVNIRWESALGRYIRVEQTGESGNYFWSIDEFRIVTR